MIICFCWKKPLVSLLLKLHHTLFESEANLFIVVCRIKGAAGRYPFRKEYEFSRDSITQIIHLCFRFDQLLPLKLQSSLAPHCFWDKRTFFSYDYNRNTWFHGLQAHAIQTSCSNLWGFRATVQIQVDNEDKQIKQNAM